MKYIIPPVEDYIKEHREWEKRRDIIREENERLITYWKSIPWWQFWKQIPFEKKRNIIINNWRSIR